MQAWAHAGEGGFVLLLPTDYYIAGGTIAVAVSFLLLLFVPATVVRRFATARVAICRTPEIPESATSVVAFAILVLLLLSGWYGTRDPLRNPLPLTIWNLWWAGLTIAQALFGKLWALFNPWIAPCRALRRLLFGSATNHAPMGYPGWLGYWPAVFSFLAFAWFELVDPAPDDPARLALAVTIYSTVTIAGMLCFGERAWLARAECFSVFFTFVARLAPLQVRRLDTGGRCRPTLHLVFPGASLADRDALPIAGVLFVLLTLASVSFDGLSRTFWWLDLGGVNPLEFPGRTAVVPLNSLGLVAMWATLAAAFTLAIGLGRRLVGRHADLRADLGAFVLSVLPISIGYHFAHYLTIFMVDAQYGALALGDPFALGWDLFGLGQRHVTVSFLSDYHAVSIIWRFQASGVVLGHIVAVALAHAIAVNRFGTARAALRSQIPLATLMIGYTLFGLWLLAAPAVG